MTRKAIYSRWINIKKRCYDIEDSNYKSYGAKGVTVCDEWLTFENFYKWFIENLYPSNELLAVDKDIVGDGMIYSPDNCIIIPFKINGILVHKDNGDMRGIQQVGVRFQVKVRNTLTGKNEYHGTYDTIETAKRVYMSAKTEIYQSVVDEYRDKIPQSLYFILKGYTF